MNIGPLHIISNSGELTDVILEQIDYGLLAINTGIFAVEPIPHPLLPCQLVQHT
jgi:hypothetical protein